jgi:hypothetical protein
MSLNTNSYKKLPEGGRFMLDNPKLKLARTLRTCATITIFIGGLASLYYLYKLGFVRDPAYKYLNEKIFSPVGFASGLGVMWQVYVGWLFLKGVAILLEGQVALEARFEKQGGISEERPN